MLKEHHLRAAHENRTACGWTSASIPPGLLDSRLERRQATPRCRERALDGQRTHGEARARRARRLLRPGGLGERLISR
jgi:hypothetical protein